jgi:Sap, sulfolipid-1-addressing protein
VIAATLPLAIAMVAGPQIISAFFFATSPKWKSDSAAFILGAAAALFLVVTVAYLIAHKIAGGGSGGGTKSHGLKIAILALLVFAMAYVFHGRKRTDPPKWMGKLQTASPRFTLTLGFLLFAFFPTDIVTSISVGAHLANQGHPWSHALPFIFFTLFVVALPALSILILGEHAKKELPKIRNWMNANSWIVSEVVLAFFVLIVLAG